MMNKANLDLSSVTGNGLVQTLSSSAELLLVSSDVSAVGALPGELSAGPVNETANDQKGR